jgi:hypothetical protein
VAVLASQTASRSENDEAASRSIRAPERLKLVNISFHNLYLALYSTIKADFGLEQEQEEKAHSTKLQLSFQKKAFIF